MAKRAIITGASSGIGKALAVELVNEGWDLVLVARRKEQLEQIAESLPTNTQVVALDLTNRDALESWIDTLANQQIDLFINNAGFGDQLYFAQSDPNKMDGMIELNIRALTRLCRAVAPVMIAQGSGAIVNVASVAAFTPGPLMAVYFATKAYVLSFSEALQNELAPAGVHVMTLCPGATQTEFASRAGIDGVYSGQSNLPTSQDVARFTLKSLKVKRIIAIEGTRNRLMIFLLRLIPRSTAVKFTRRILDK